MKTMERVSVPDALWSEEKQRHLCTQLGGFWAQDEWLMTQCPLVKGTSRPRTLKFFCNSSALNTELKYVFWHQFTSCNWSAQTWHETAYLDRLIAWLNQVAPPAPSFLAWSLEKWDLSLRSYLIEQGLLRENSVGWKLDRSQQPHSYARRDHCHTLLHV